MKLGKKPQEHRTSLDRRRAGRRARVVRSGVGSNTITPQKSTTTTQTVRRPARIAFVGFLVCSFLVWTAITTGTEVVADQAVSNQAKQQAQVVSKQYFRGLQRVWWFSSPEKLRKSMSENAPYVKDFTVHRTPFTRKVVITVEERKPTLRLRTQNRQYLVSGDGVILEETEARKDLPLVYDESTVDTLELYKPYIPESVVSLMTQLRTVLKKDVPSFQFKEFVLIDNTREIQSHQAKGYFVKFNSITKAQRQVDDLNRTLTKLPKSKKQQLEYIDVRFSGKVYVK